MRRFVRVAQADLRFDETFQRPQIVLFYLQRSRKSRQRRFVFFEFIKPQTGFGKGFRRVVQLLFLTVCVGDFQINFRVLRVEFGDLLPNRQGFDFLSFIFILFGERGVMFARFGERAFQMVKLRQLRRNLHRVRFDAENLVVNGDGFMRKTLIVVMLGDLRETADGFLIVEIFGVQIAQNVQRAEILRIVFDDSLILVNCRANLALGQKSLGISHSFYFIEAHCEFNASNPKFVFSSVGMCQRGCEGWNEFPA